MNNVCKPIAASGSQDQRRNDLLKGWCKTYGRPAPKNLSTQFMQRAQEWERQTKVSGGLSASTKRSLRTLRKMTPDQRTKRVMPRKLKAGAHLVRVWNGRTYQVEVVGDGFVMDGRGYKSLSAIAKKITGANWSGPRFFGLNGI